MSDVQPKPPVPFQLSLHEPGPALPLAAYQGLESAGARRLIWIVVSLVCVLLLLLAVMPVRGVSTAMGLVVTEQPVVEVAHPEGGVVREILVAPGERVAAGAALIILRGDAAGAERAQAGERRIALLLAQERLQALLANRRAEFAALAGSGRAAQREAETAYRAELDAYSAEVQAFESRLAARRAEAVSLREQLESQRRQLAFDQENLANREALLKGGWLTEAALLEAESRLNRSQAEIARLTGLLRQSEAALAEARSAQASALAERRRAWSNELASVNANLLATETAEVRLAERLNDVTLSAPLAGLVQDVMPVAAGAVLGAGAAAVRLVPEGEQLVAEIRIAPDDIAQVRPGARARMLITAFDTELFKPVQGEVTHVSPTTFRDESGAFYYLARVSLPAQVERTDGGASPILPGMLLRAEVIGAERPLLQVMLRPIDRALSRAFAELG